MKLEFEAAVAAIRGAREKQEDASTLSFPKGKHKHGRADCLLAVVADGMGGHVGGEIASNIVCNIYRNTFREAPGSVPQRLSSCLKASNEAIFDAIQEDSELDGMGCTLIAAYIDLQGITWISVGDSLLLLYREGKLQRLNEDHSMGAVLDRQAELGEISIKEANESPTRNMLRSAISGEEINIIDASNKPFKLMHGDWLLLASDGVETLAMNSMCELVEVWNGSSPGAMGGHILEAVKSRKLKHQDNTTIMAVKVVDSQLADETEAPTIAWRRHSETADKHN